MYNLVFLYTESSIVRTFVAHTSGNGLRRQSLPSGGLPEYVYNLFSRAAGPFCGKNT